MIDLRGILDVVGSRARLASYWWTKCPTCDEVLAPAYLTLEGAFAVTMVFRGHLHLEEFLIEIKAPAA